jgi:DNA (cytosine-5)-methyltransferase 1
LNSPTYISVFSGIGGLEHPTVAPILLCERDAECQKVLEARYKLPQGQIVEDIKDLRSPPKADFVVGGWPCQDLSSAGKQVGIQGERSGLFFEMLRVAREADAHTIIGENVPNLLRVNKGRDFGAVKEALINSGYKYLAWRVLNSRQFGLPQDRNRLFIVASKKEAAAMALHADISSEVKTNDTPKFSGFYWTGGKRSICFSRGYVPTLKVGATDNRGRGTVAVFDGTIVRKLTQNENLRLQGFGELEVPGLSISSILRMAGNAVALPVGHFVVSSVMEYARSDGFRLGFARGCSSGFFDGDLDWQIDHKPTPLASNLDEFLDRGINQHLSSQACAGLIVRSVRSGSKMPSELFDVLYQNAIRRTGKLKASRANSFEAMEEMLSEMIEYRNSLEPVGVFEEEIDE